MSLTLEYIKEMLLTMRREFERAEKEASDGIYNQGFGIGDTEEQLNAKRLKHAKIYGRLEAINEMLLPFECEDARLREEKQARAIERMMRL